MLGCTGGSRSPAGVPAVILPPGTACKSLARIQPQRREVARGVAVQQAGVADAEGNSWTWQCVCVCVHVCVGVHVSVGACMYIRVSCVHVRVYVCLCVCGCMCVHV